MDYIEVQINTTQTEDYISDLLTAELGLIGFETFSSEDGILSAFCPKNLFNEHLLKKMFDEFTFQTGLTYSTQYIKAENWNETWEKNYFEPIILGNDCVICSSFHTNVPDCSYKILIDPKMSFGTGHHETTALMLGQLLKLDVKNKSFLDMGCGTAVLAILASMKGATPVTGIDIDEWAYNNSLENIQTNLTNDIEILLGGAELLTNKQFEVIFANINRNILLSDMAVYAAALPKNGALYISGFYVDDIPVLREEASKQKLEFISFEEKNNWATARFIKQ